MSSASFLFNSYDVYSVAQGENKALYSVVLDNHAVELYEGLGVMVVVVYLLSDLAIPEDIVGQKN